MPTNALSNRLQHGRRFDVRASALVLLAALTGCSYWNGTGRATTGTLRARSDQGFEFVSLTDEHSETTRLDDGTYYRRSVVSRDLLHVGFLFPGALTFDLDATYDETRVLWATYSTPRITYQATFSIDRSTGEVGVIIRRSAQGDDRKELSLVQPIETFSFSRGNLFALRRNQDDTLTVTQVASFAGTRPRDSEQDDVDDRRRRLAAGFEPVLRELSESADSATTSKIAAAVLRWRVD